MDVVLNEPTRTVHKCEPGASDLHTECGVTHHATPDQLRLVPLEQAASDFNADKCGRCFEDGGGY